MHVTVQCVHFALVVCNCGRASNRSYRLLFIVHATSARHHLLMPAVARVRLQTSVSTTVSQAVIVAATMSHAHRPWTDNAQSHLAAQKLKLRSARYTWVIRCAWR